MSESSESYHGGNYTFREAERAFTRLTDIPFAVAVICEHGGFARIQRIQKDDKSKKDLSLEDLRELREVG